MSNKLGATYRLTIFVPASMEPSGVEGTTPLTPIAGAPHSDQFKIATSEGIAGFKPYLGMPAGRRGRLDVLSKKTDTGELTFDLLDMRVTAGGSNAVRWVTAFLGDNRGLPRFGKLLTKVEESLDGGLTWNPYFVGRARMLALKSGSRVMYQLAVKDLSDDLTYKVFLGQPHSTVDLRYGSYSSTRYAQLISVMPVGVAYPYGALPPTAPSLATVGVAGADGSVPITLLTTEYVRLENIVVRSFLEAVTPTSMIENAPATGAAGTPAQFTGLATARLTWNGGANTGDFMVGYGYSLAPMTFDQIFNYLKTGQRKVVWTLGLKPLPYPIGVATGTPQANGAQGSAPTAQTSSVTTKGWTINITGILKQGDIVSFAGHLQRYVVTTDANSDGSGNATVVLHPGLQSAIANNEAITVQASPNRAALPANGTQVSFVTFLDMRMADGGQKDVNGNSLPGNLLFINDVHPVQLLKDVLAGYYGLIRRPTFDPASSQFTCQLPPGGNLGDPWRSVPINSTAFTNLIADTTFPAFRCIIDKAVPIREFIEQYICKPYGIGYYFDAAGNFTPVDLRQPVAAPATTITDADLADGQVPKWSYDAAQATPIYRATVYAEGITQPIAGKLDTSLQVPIITSKMVEAQSADIVDLAFGNPDLSQKEYTIDGKGYRAMPAEFNYIPLGGINFSVRTRWDTIRQQILRMGHLTGQRPYANGPQIVTLPCTRASANAASVFPGTFFQCTATAFPNANTNKRLIGSDNPRVILCTERVEKGLALDLTGVDWGVATLATAPTVGTPATLTGDTSHSCFCPITLNGGGEAVEVWINVTATSVGAAPADTDPGWVPLCWLFHNANAIARGLGAGGRVWFRARTNPRRNGVMLGADISGNALEIPSAWVHSTNVDLTALSAATALASSGIFANQFTVTWSNPDPTKNVEIWVSQPVTDPRQFVARLPAGSTSFTLKGLAASTTYRLAVRETDGVGGFTEATIDVATSASISVPKPPVFTRIGRLLT